MIYKYYINLIASCNTISKEVRVEKGRKWEKKEKNFKFYIW